MKEWFWNAAWTWIESQLQYTELKLAAVPTNKLLHDICRIFCTLRCIPVDVLYIYIEVNVHYTV
jgi:hypothetical protein